MNVPTKSLEKADKAHDAPSRSRSSAHNSTPPALSTGFGIADIQQTAGNIAIQRMFGSKVIQAKLSISQPGDPYEQEADQVTEQVMSSALVPPIQRKCDACATGGTCPKCEVVPKFQLKELPGRMTHITPKVESSLASLRGGGQPLPASVRAFFEPRFGQDFSGVRVHTSGEASEAARSIQAKAFTVGQDIAFGAGQFVPESGEGKRLLAHELAHTVQQRNGAFSPQGTRGVQRSPDADGPSIWDTISQGAKGAGSAVATGVTSVGNAVVQGVRDAGGAVIHGTESVGATIAQGAKSAAGSVVQTVASAGSELLALEEKLAKFNALLKNYSPLPDGLIRLKNEVIAEKARLSDLGGNLQMQVATPLPGQVAGTVPPVGGGGTGTAGGGGIGEAAGGCGLCYGEAEGAVGPREAGLAAHKVIQNVMFAEHGIEAELPVGKGRIDLAVVRDDLKQIEVGEIKPLNDKNIDAGLDQLAARLRVIPTLAKYADYKIKPLKYPVRQPIRFETNAPFCREQPGFCFSQDLSVIVIPSEGLYLYTCKPSYSELLSGGCKCKCAERLREPVGDSAEEREKKRQRERQLQPVAVNWAKVAYFAMIAALAVATIALAICAFATGATIVGIPVAAVCAVGGFATATAMVALLVKTRSEPDTVA